MNKNAIIWFLISMALYTIGSFLSKKYAIAPSWQIFLAAVVAFAGCSAAWLPAMLIVNKLAVLGVLWSVAYVIVDFTIGVGCFGEPLTRIQVCGMVLGVASIILLSQ
jgi:hypothetical protein